MDYVSIIVNILTLISVLICGWLIKNYFPAYFSEKGKNLATKEDIGEITDKIERTRIQYLAAIEKVKSELTVSAAHKTKLKEKEREALLDFFENCVILLSEKLLYNFGDLTYSESKQLMEYDKSVNTLFTQTFICYHRLILYLPNDNPLLSASHNLIDSVLSARIVFRKHFGKYRIALHHECEAMADGNKESLHAHCAATDIASKEYYGQMNPVTDKLKTSLHNYIVALNSYFQDSGSSKLPDIFLD